MFRGRIDRTGLLSNTAGSAQDCACGLIGFLDTLFVRNAKQHPGNESDNRVSTGLRIAGQTAWFAPAAAPLSLPHRRWKVSKLYPAPEPRVKHSLSHTHATAANGS